MNHPEGITLNLKAFIAVISMVGMVVGAHFLGIATAKDHADQGDKEIRIELNDKVEKLNIEVHDTKTDIAVIKQILIERYGLPKNGISDK